MIRSGSAHSGCICARARCDAKDASSCSRIRHCGLTVPSNAILRRMSGEPIAEDVARRHGLTLIVQFGSTVSGKAHEKSDVDVAVLFDRSPPTPDDQSRLLQDLQPCSRIGKWTSPSSIVRIRCS